MNLLRPTKFEDIIGQDDIKTCLNISIESAKQRRTVLNHCLFSGLAGGGKTTIALAVADKCGSKIFLANGGNIKNSKDVLPYLSRLRRGDILFIDEIHRVHNRVQESLYTVLEDFRFDICKGAKNIQFEPFTLLGATTEPALLLKPFIDRFVHKFILEPYTIDELSSIIKKSADKLKVRIDDDGVLELARRSRFTPRIANSLLMWCVDFAQVARSVVNKKTVCEAMELKKIDSRGLDSSDRVYLEVLQKANKPLGLSTLVASTGLSKDTIEGQVEPYLLRLCLIDKTPKGRVIL